MSISDAFRTFLCNIKVDNSNTIAIRYEEITGALNQEFRDTDSKFANRLRIGSYGRWTAIKGVSDLDMLYIMPAWRRADYEDGGQYALLQYALLKRTADAIRARYPRTPVKVGRLVVQVRYVDFHVEVQPVFEKAVRP